MLIEDGQSQTNLREEESKEREHVANLWLKTPNLHKVKWSEISTVVYLTWRIFPGGGGASLGLFWFLSLLHTGSNSEPHHVDLTQLMKSDNNPTRLRLRKAEWRQAQSQPGIRWTRALQYAELQQTSRPEDHPGEVWNLPRDRATLQPPSRVRILTQERPHWFLSQKRGLCVLYCPYERITSQDSHPSSGHQGILGCTYRYVLLPHMGSSALLG